MDGNGRTRLTAISKAALVLLVGADLLAVELGLRRRPLPALVAHLDRRPWIRLRPLEPRRLAKLVYRALCLGPGPPRCLVSSLVLFRLLRRQGTVAELVIGLPPSAVTHEAHAWVEASGDEVGPPPGRRGHVELARYGRAGRAGNTEA